MGAGTFGAAGNSENVLSSVTLVIQGAGSQQTIINLNNQGRGFIITNNAHVTINGLTIANGNGAVNPYSLSVIGGAVIVNNAKLTMTDVVMRNCSALQGAATTPSGGCLHTTDADLTMTSCSLLNCHSGIAGGWYSGGSTTSILDKVTIANCTTAPTGWGGGWVPNDNTLTVITNSLFEYNTAGYGGALDDGSSAHYNISDTIFRGNSAQYGGVLFTYGVAVSFWKNCSFYENSAYNTGGVVRTTSSTSSTFDSCYFELNTALGGGGVFSALSDGATVALNCIFRRNFAQLNGGAIEQNGPMTVYNSLFEENWTNYKSSVYDVIGTGAALFSNNTMRRNSCVKGTIVVDVSADAPPIQFNNLVFDSNTASESAGALWVSNGATVTISNCQFTNNSATVGGAIQTQSRATLNIVDSTFTNNQATNGGVANFGEATVVTISGTTFENNIAILYGGAIYHEALAQPSLSSVTFTNNSAQFGGAYSIASKATKCFAMAQVSFVGNTAVVGGGAMYFQGFATNCNFTNLCSDCVMTDNTALYGSELASAPYLLQFRSSPPESLSASQIFTVSLVLLDQFDQQVQQQEDTLVTASLGSSNATLQGIVNQQASIDGTVTFQLLKVNAFPGTPISLMFTTKPSSLVPAVSGITVSECQANAVTYSEGGQYHCLDVNGVRYATVLSISVITAVLIALSVALLVLLIVKRKHSVIHKASPPLCWMITIGAIICYISAYMWLDTDDPYCVLRIILLVIGFSLMYGSFFVKEWRLYRLFKFDSLKIKKISDLTLIRIVAVVVSFELLIVLFWLIFFPYLQRIDVDLASSQETITYQCYTGGSGFFYALLSINGVLLLLGCLLAILTRNIPANYNESKYLAFSVYNATLTLCVIVPVCHVLTNPDDISVAVTSGILFSTTASLISLFAPKLHLTLTKGAIVKALNSKLEKLERDIAWIRKQRSEFRDDGTSVNSSRRSTPPTTVAATIGTTNTNTMNTQK
jgi:predicted outer membrane repeat protein